MLPVPAVMRELQVQAPYAHLFRRVPAESPAEEATDAPPPEARLSAPMSAAQAQKTPR